MRYLLSLIIFLISMTHSAYCMEYKSTIDYIEKTNKLWGISACIVNDDGSVTFVDRKSSGTGYALWMPDGKGGFFEQVSLKPGDSLRLIDGDHVFITYEYVRLEDTKITIKVTDTFDARSFGDDIKTEHKIVTIAPYKDEEVR